MKIYQEASRKALEMIAEQFEPYQALCHLTTAAEFASPGLCHRLLLDEGGLLRNGASPKLPLAISRL